MSTTFLCTKGKMGEIEYYLLKMKAGILISSVGFAEELPEWENMLPEEKTQRKLNEDRVIQEITPYLVNDSKRFFGALIVDIYKGWEKVEFESLVEMGVKLPKAYNEQVRDVGFITLPDNRSLIALDGQHRLLALKIAIRGYRGLKNEGMYTSKELQEKLKPHPELYDEDISIILVKHTDNTTIRQIFNKVNRYAKATSKADNIITSEDDICAIVSRKLLIEGEPLESINDVEVVNVKSNTIAKRSKQLTTLSAIYEFNQEILGKSAKTIIISEEMIQEAYKKIKSIWETLLANVEDYQKYFQGLMEKGEISILREKSLLLKPVTQIALAIAYKKVESKGVDIEEFSQLINLINWSYDAEIWQQILIVPNTNKMIANRQAIRNAGNLIAYLVAGNRFNDKEIQELLESIHCLKPGYELPQL